MIIAKFRKKKSNSDLLEKIDKEITSIENFQRNTEQQRKRIVGSFLVASVGIYILSAVVFYFFYFYPQNFKERLLYLVPFILAPTFIFFMKRTISWYFNRKLTKNQKKMVDLRSEKKKILENIMETETYKVARGLLEKYAPEQVRRVNIGQELTPIRNTSVAAMTPSNQAGLRNRIPPNSGMSLKSNITQTPLMNAKGPGPSQLSMATPFNRNLMTVAPTPITPIPRYIPSKDRTFLDKVVDYLIGDGPNNRYALICKQCSGHNGMALMDEFEYVSFKCCYCMAVNSARKVRPIAPKLHFDSPELPQLPAPVSDQSGTSESEKNSGSDTDAEDADVRPTPTLETLFRKHTESRGVGNDEATVSSDNEPNDFDKLSDLESRDSEVEAQPVNATQTIE